MRIALGLEYDGGRFCGWQSQLSGCAVQDVLEAALSRVAGCAIRVVSAGRTDAGVHALAQVVHFDTATERPPGAWVRGVNAHLPAGVAVLWMRQVADDFHARFSARSRSYHYLLLNRPVRPALLQGRIGWFHQPLDLERMREAARALVGTHDFSAFRSAECQAKTPVKELTRLSISRQGDIFMFEFRANAFLHHMVRNIMGCLVYVGKGKHPAEWPRELLEGRDRALAAPTFSPDGLYLAGIEYDPAWGLPAEAVTVAAFPVCQRTQ